MQSIDVNGTMNKKKIWVYAADTSVLSDDRAFGEGYQQVSRRRQEKIDRFLFRKDKELSLGAELLLKRCLQMHGIAAYQIQYGEHRKPYLKECMGIDGRTVEETLYFNLSHSGQRVMCVISNVEAGCDVEKVKEIDMKVAQHFFVTEEYERVAAQETEEKRQEMFFRIWTLKESLMKATGLGMTLAPESFQVDVEHGNGEYHFKEYDPLDGYKYAVCGKTDDFAEEICFLKLL